MSRDDATLRDYRNPISGLGLLAFGLLWLAAPALILLWRSAPR